MYQQLSQNNPDILNIDQNGVCLWLNKHGIGNITTPLILEPGNSPENLNITFGPLGSFVYNMPKLLPSPIQTLPPPKKAVSKDTSYVYKLSKDQCKEALKKWVDKQCCKSSLAIKDGHFVDVWTYNALDTRSIESAFSSITPGTECSLNVDVLPDPWSFPCTPNQMFISHKKLIPLPNTEIIQPCFACNAIGKLKCKNCSGNGTRTCVECRGSGSIQRTNQVGESYSEKCSCDDGCLSCLSCDGSGTNICKTCNGAQSIKWFLQVVVDFINHRDHYMKDKTSLPDELIEKAEGEELCHDEAVTLEPILDSDCKDVVENSTTLIQKSNQAYSQEYRVLQRQVLRCVTCAECSLSFHGKEYKFYVYGSERNIYFPDYPGGCCCCCCLPCCIGCPPYVGKVVGISIGVVILLIIIALFFLFRFLNT